MPLSKPEVLTIDHVVNLPDGQRAELVDGYIYDLAAPSRIHQKISGSVFNQISNHIRDKKMECDVYAAPFGVFLDDYNYLEPDISVICDKDKLSDRGCEGAPDWIIEIVSPSSQRIDYLIKLNKYRSAGVRLYWIIDPDLRAVMVHDFERDTMQRYKFGNPVPVSICEDFSITITDD